MSFFEFPHTRTYDSDLGWLIWAMKKLIGDMTEFTEINSIKFGDPINWNIATQYEPTTIVVDVEGNGYISRKAVPAGIALTDSDYWTRIFNFSDITDAIRSGIAVNNGDSATALQAMNKNDLIWWNGNMYQVLYDIAAGTALINGTNIKPFTVDEKINSVGGNIEQIVSDLNNEIQARKNADTALQGAIATEVTAREQADNALQNLIDGLTFDAEYKTFDVAGRTIKTKLEKTGSYQLGSHFVLDRDELNGSYSGFYVQSCEYIGQNQFMIGMSTESYSTSLIVITDNNFNILNRYQIDLGHCNDIAYDMKNGKIFVATYETGTYANSIVVLNRNTMAIEHVIPFASGVARVAYDALNDVLYLTRSGGVSYYISEIMNPDTYEIIASYNIPPLTDFVPDIVTQGGVVLDGNYYQIGCKWRWLDSNNGTYMFNIRPDGTYGKTYAFPQMTGDEVEGVTYDDKNMYMIAHNYVTENVHVYVYPLYNSSVPINATLFSGYGINLNDGDDLNNLIDGKYNKPQGATNVLNWPPNQNGGTIYQIGCGYNHTLQIACLNNGMILTRNRMANGKNGQWTYWFPITGEIMTGVQSFDLAGGYLSNAAKSIFGTIPTYMFLQPNIGNLLVYARSVEGKYLITNEALSTFNYSLTKTGNMCRLQISKKDGTTFNAPNNTPVAVQMNGTL